MGKEKYSMAPCLAAGRGHRSASAGFKQDSEREGGDEHSREKTDVHREGGDVHSRDKVDVHNPGSPSAQLQHWAHTL